MTLSAPPAPPPAAPVSRLVRARAGWILATAVLVVLGAVSFSLLRTPTYEATAEVVVLPEVTPSGPSPQTPSMGTEKSLVLSDVVASGASRRLGVPLPALVDAATVIVPAQTETLQITCSMTEPVLAARCAQGLGEAYVAYKDSQPIPTVPERARVVTPAVPPSSAATPDLVLDLLAGLVVGLVLGVLVALVRDRLDDRVRGAADLERRGLRVLGVVPTRGAGAGDGSAPAERARAFGALAARIRTALDREPSTSSPESPAAPLVTPVVVVTATAEEDTGEAPAVATSLATALASAGERVVLVHADTASPSGTAPEPGLLDVLAGRVGLDTVVRRAVHPQLRDLPVGRRPPLRIGGRDWARVTERLAGSADVVVVAADPMLVTANGLTVARGSTAVVAVAVGRTTTRAEVDGFVRECRDLGLPLLGTVLSTDAVRRTGTAADADWGRWTDERDPAPAGSPAPAGPPEPARSGDAIPSPRPPASPPRGAPRGTARVGLHPSTPS